LSTISSLPAARFCAGRPAILEKRDFVLETWRDARFIRMRACAGQVEKVENKLWPNNGFIAAL
jgi:hypothetical protein